MREYIIQRKSIDLRPTRNWWESYSDPVDVLARTVYERDETVDIGILDEHGNKILVREKRNPVGFIWKD